MKKTTVAIALLAAAMAGCTATKYGQFSRYTLGTKTTIPELDVSTNGTIHIKGYSSDSVEAFKAGVELGKTLHP